MAQPILNANAQAFIPGKKANAAPLQAPITGSIMDTSKPFQPNSQPIYQPHQDGQQMNSSTGYQNTASFTPYQQRPAMIPGPQPFNYMPQQQQYSHNYPQYPNQQMVRPQMFTQPQPYYYQQYQAHQQMAPIVQSQPLNQSQAPPKSLNFSAQEFIPSNKQSQANSTIHSKATSPKNQTSAQSFQEQNNTNFAEAVNKQLTPLQWVDNNFQPANNSISYHSSDFRVSNEVLPQPPSQLNLSAAVFVPGGAKSNANQQRNAAQPPQEVKKEEKPKVEPPKKQAVNLDAIPKDALSEKLQRLNFSPDDIVAFRDLTNQIKSAKNNLSVELIKQFKTLAYCQKAPSSFWKEQNVRVPEERTMEKQGFTKGAYKPNQGQGRGQNRNYNQDNRRGGYQGQQREQRDRDGQQRDQFDRNTQRPQQREETQFDPLKRAEADKLKVELAEKSKKVLEKAKGDKNIQQQIRLIVNVITPDNFEKKFEELRKLMFGERKTKEEEGYDESSDKLNEQVNEENMKVVVETIFRKAQNEREYGLFYGELCEKIIRLELSLRGLQAKIKTIKESNFRKALLNNCKNSFNQFFNEDIKEKRKTMDQEEQIKFQHRLFGNIQFVGELNRRNLLQENIIISVFEMLLGMEGSAQYLNDDTVEGATVLMNKIGNIIDSKIQKMQQQIDESAKKKNDKNLVTIKKFQDIFKKFEELQSENSPISLRIRMLIKNLLENRSSNWEKTHKQNESGPKKVEDLRKELEEKARKEEELRKIAEMEEQSYLEKDRGYGGGRDNKYGRSGTTYVKKESFMGYKEGGDRQDNKGKRNSQYGRQNSVKTAQTLYVKKQSSNVASIAEEFKEIDDKLLEKRVVENFHSYCNIIVEEGDENQKPNIPSDHFNVFKELQTVYRRKGEELVYQFLNKVYDSDEKAIMNTLPQYLSELFATQYLSRDQFTKGLSKFLKFVPDLVMDYPKLSTYLSLTMLTLIELNAINPTELEFIDAQLLEGDEDDASAPMVESYFTLMAEVSKLYYNKTKSWKKVVSYFKDNGLDAKLHKLKKLILQDTIFEEITQQIGEKYSEVIVPLLSNDEPSLQQALNNNQ